MSDVRIKVHDRFHVVSWQFGSIHQCKVIVEYPWADRNHTDVGVSVGVCLRPGKTRKAAITRGRMWVQDYLRMGPGTFEEALEECFRNWPDLFPDRDRRGVLEQMFVTTGGEYDWLDGALINTDDQGPLPKKHKKSPIERQVNRLLKKLSDTPEGKVLYDQWKADERSQREARKVRPLIGLSRYSNICNVPPDVRPDWLEAAREAAQLLTLEGEPNRTHGQQLVELLARDPSTFGVELEAWRTATWPN